MDEEEDFFGDDSLDDIPDGTLKALEEHAFSSTQAARPNNAAVAAPLTRQVGAPRPYPRAYPSGNVRKDMPWRSPQPQGQPALRSQPPPPAPAPPPSAPEQPPSSDYGFDDEDVIDLDEPSMVIEAASGPPTRQTSHSTYPTATTQYAQASKTLDPETEAAFLAADAELGAQQPQWARAPQVQPHIDVSALQARIATLEAQTATLQQTAEQARTAALAKQGEIAIVRSNHDKQSREYDRRIEVMRKLHADEAAKTKSELEVARKERERVESENKFLQHDLMQEAERAGRAQGGGVRAGAMPRASEGLKERQNGSGIAMRGVTTPKKSKNGGMGDGFDDFEMVMVVSPGKSKEKGRDATPKAGAKRKRPVNDSPAQPLAFTQPPAPPSREAFAVSGQVTSTGDAAIAVQMPGEEDGRFAFMQRLLNHRPHLNHERTIEALTKHSLPSHPTSSLASMLLDDLASPTKAMEDDRLSIRTCRSLLALWSSCLVDKYYAPVSLLLDMLDFTLLLELSTVRAALVDQAIPMCIKSIDLLAAPRSMAGKNPKFAASLDHAVRAKLAREIDDDAVLAFLSALCMAASVSPETAETFWKAMNFEFTLQMLNRAQPIEQVNCVLRMLGTSVLESSFGCMCSIEDADADGKTQRMQESGAIDRLTMLLFEEPLLLSEFTIPVPATQSAQLPDKEQPYTDEEVCRLRFEVLSVLRAMCLTAHGSRALAEHRTAIGRLVRFLDGQVNSMYFAPPSMADLSLSDTKDRASDNSGDGNDNGAYRLSGLDNDSGQEPEPSLHHLLVQTINTTVLILHHLLTSPQTQTLVDLRPKLAVTKGGHHRFLISLTRIAFAEGGAFSGSFLDHGITDSVINAAHAILDGVLSPEEGEAVVAAVETPLGTKSTTTRKGSGSQGTEVGREGEGDGDVTMSFAPG